MKHESMMPIINAHDSVCNICVYGGNGFSRECHQENSPYTTNILRPEECSAYNKIVHRKYEEDFWRLYEEEEQYRLEQERLLNDDD